MTKSLNFNRPAPGSVIRVEPIRNAEDRRKVETMLELENHLRDLGIFVLGCNVNLRASDLVRLTVGDVRGKRPGGL